MRNTGRNLKGLFYKQHPDVFVDHNLDEAPILYSNPNPTYWCPPKVNISIPYKLIYILPDQHTDAWDTVSVDLSPTEINSSKQINPRNKKEQK